jgi:hypothetical protein
MKRLKSTITVTVALMTGCETTEWTPHETPTNPVTEGYSVELEVQMTLQSWVGHSLAEARKVWGEPTRTEYGNFRWQRTIREGDTEVDGAFLVLCNKMGIITATGWENPRVFIWGLNGLGAPGFNLDRAIRQRERERPKGPGGPPRIPVPE